MKSQGTRTLDMEERGPGFFHVVIGGVRIYIISKDANAGWPSDYPDHHDWYWSYEGLSIHGHGYSKSFEESKDDALAGIEMAATEKVTALRAHLQANESLLAALEATQVQGVQA